MSTSGERLFEANTQLRKRYGACRIARNWLWIRFRDFRRFRLSIPPWPISPMYARDHKVFDCVRRTLQELSKKGNKGKTAYFRSMEEDGIIVTREQLDGMCVDPSVFLTTIARLETFLAIYQVENELAQSLVPYVEIADELDEAIERFESNGATMLPFVERLSRKRFRRDMQAFGSGLLALYVLIVYVLASEVNLISWGSVSFLAFTPFLLLLILLGIGIWRSFPPILSASSTNS